MQYEIICTFRESEQIVLILYYNSDVTEQNFINEIFNLLNIKELKQLVKLSCCQLYTDSYTKLLPFIQKNNGKYYFNIDINKDSETKYWNDFKNKYIEKRIKKNLINRFISISILIGSVLFISKRGFNNKKMLKQNIRIYQENNIEKPINKSIQLQQLHPYYTPYDIIIS